MSSVTNVSHFVAHISNPWIYTADATVKDDLSKLLTVLKKIHNTYPRKNNEDTMTKVIMTEKTKFPSQTSRHLLFLMY